MNPGIRSNFFCSLAEQWLRSTFLFFIVVYSPDSSIVQADRKRKYQRDTFYMYTAQYDHNIRLYIVSVGSSLAIRSIRPFVFVAPFLFLALQNDISFSFSFFSSAAISNFCQQWHKQMSIVDGEWQWSSIPTQPWVSARTSASTRAHHARTTCVTNFPSVHSSLMARYIEHSPGI